MQAGEKYSNVQPHTISKIHLIIPSEKLRNSYQTCLFLPPSSVAATLI